MKLNEREINVLLQALDSGYLFYSEGVSIFAGRKFDHFTYKVPKNERDFMPDEEFTQEETERYLLSILYVQDNEFCLHRCEPSEIILLTKELKVIFIKAILNGEITLKKEMELCFSYVLRHSDIANSEQAAERRKNPDLLSNYF